MPAPTRPRVVNGKLKSEQDKAARATVFMLERVKGKSTAEIASEFNCCRATVDNYLAYARQHNLVVNQARLLVGEQLIPLALAVYKTRLEMGDLEAAQDLLFGTGVLQKTSAIKHQSADGEETLEGFRNSYFRSTVEALPAHESIEPAHGRQSDVQHHGAPDGPGLLGIQPGTPADPAK